MPGGTQSRRVRVRKTAPTATCGRVPTLAPRLSCRRFRSRIATVTVGPLFPRYIFARFCSTELLHKVRFTRGVTGVVSFGGYPVPIDEEVIALIRSRIGEDGLVTVTKVFQPGDKVMIEDGPFKNLMGIFDSHVNGSLRVRILLSTVGCRAHVEIDRDLIERCTVS